MLSINFKISNKRHCEFAAFINSNYQLGKYIYELAKTNVDFTGMDRNTLETDLFKKALREESNTEQLKQTDLFQNFTSNADQKIYDEIMRLIINDIEKNYLYELIELYIRTDAKERLLKLIIDAVRYIGDQNQIIINIKTKYQDIINDPQFTIYKYLKDNNIKYTATRGNIHIIDTIPITLSQRILDIAYFNKINITQRSGDTENPIEHKKILPDKIEIE